MNRQQRRAQQKQSAPTAEIAIFATALQHHQAGRLDEAVQGYRRGLAIKPDHVQAQNNLGNALLSLGKPDEAVACYQAALQVRPDFAMAHNNLGTALQTLGQIEAAAACYRSALRHQADYPEAHYNLGSALQMLGRLAEAIGCYRRAVALRSDYVQALSNLGQALVEQGGLDEAEAVLRHALSLQPDSPEARTNLGNALKDQGRLEEAMACYQRAIALRLSLPEAHNNLGVALREQMRLDEAITCYHNALTLRPSFAAAHYHLATALLAKGDLAAGWLEAEWRWQTPHMTAAQRCFTQPQWHGATAAGQTLLIHAEQGYGDTLQFCRYATLAAERGLRVVVQVPKPLVRLLRSLTGVALVLGEDEALPEFDLHCPMMSLPLAFGTTLDSIPAVTPYLWADDAAVTVWQDRLSAMGRGGPRVGVVWAGNPRLHLPSAAAIDRRRSLKADVLAPIFAIPGVHFVSLQKDGPRAPEGVALTDVMAEMGDFADTAALITALDVVISVDTAVAHLAAALGKPVWLLDRFDHCWRWPQERTDSPWYPGLRIYRQPRAGEWGSVVDAVARDLGVLAGV